MSDHIKPKFSSEHGPIPAHLPYASPMLVTKQRGARAMRIAKSDIARAVVYECVPYYKHISRQLMVTDEFLDMEDHDSDK